MKITYTQNPLNSVVQLSDIEVDYLRAKIASDELIDRLFDIHYCLTYKNLAIDKAIEHTKNLSDPSYYVDDTDGKSPLNERVDFLLEEYIISLKEPHCGDCICAPCTCTKCMAEHYLSIDTIPKLGKHEAHFIKAAFDSVEENNILGALDYLKSYEPYAKWNGWEAHAERWKEESTRAYEWLHAYKKAHFSDS